MMEDHVGQVYREDGRVYGLSVALGFVQTLTGDGTKLTKTEEVFLV